MCVAWISGSVLATFKLGPVRPARAVEHPQRIRRSAPGAASVPCVRSGERSPRARARVEGGTCAM